MTDSDTTMVLDQSTEWTLTYDDSLEWHTDVPLFDATTMLEGLFQGVGLSPQEVPAFVKANYERPVTVLWNGTSYYEGTVGKLAWIVLDEMRDAQQEKRSAEPVGPALR